MNQEIIQAVLEEKIVAIIRGISPENIIPTVNALYKGGIKLAEITYSADGCISDEKTASVIGDLCEEFKDKMYIGAGTVLTKRQLELTKAAGGRFIISPDANADIIRHTKELGLVSMPGALTPTEIQNAHICGADFVKVFPATGLGTAYIKALKAPLSHIRLLAVGGVNLNNIKDFLDIGVCGFGIGANIADKTLAANGEFDKIEDLARKYVEAVK